MMIDFHCHILPGIDDGSANMDESIKLARQSVEAGVTHVVATPHGSSENLVKVLEERDRLLVQLRAELARENIPLALIPGLEYMADGHSDRAAIEHPGCRCGENPTDASPMLIELNFNLDLPFVGEVLFKSQIKGIRMILAHPERYDGFVKNAKMLANLMDKGLILQFNANNFKKRFFFMNSVSRTMLKLIAHDPDSVLVGSDAHNPEMRPAGLAEAQKRITAELGEKVWNKISLENPKRLLRLK